MCKMLPCWTSQVRNLLPTKERSLPFELSSASLVRVTSPVRFVSYCIRAGVLTCVHPKSSSCGFPCHQKALNISKWKEAILEETNALERNETWEMVEATTWKKIVGCKWVFTIKVEAVRSLKRYKACLVSKGLTQTYGIDYLEAFAPVAKLNSIRVFLTIATNLYWPFQQLDVKNAFDQIEEVYVDPPWVLKKGVELECAS